MFGEIRHSGLPVCDMRERVNRYWPLSAGNLVDVIFLCGSTGRG